jgi:hypothetical protein
MVHVFQNRPLGRHTFLALWMQQVAEDGYKNAQLEKDAYAVQDLVNSEYCDIMSNYDTLVRQNKDL